ncbi:gliding motility-associated C-terminal domain-containing protein [Flavobacterium sp. ZB4P13]|uniref:gliding motility-associated C-terminal domain-containing protein n=1 Tax=Flavobacterium sp. ZB4P13 TaxID=3401728 RepID=UPI003AAB6D5B
MKYRFFFSVKYILFTWLILSSSAFLFAQTGAISKPILAFTQNCDSPDVTGSFKVSFTFAPTFQPTNQFILELSDASGSFTNNPTVLYTSAAGAVTVSPADFFYRLPTSTNGEKYQLRVRSTAPVDKSPLSNVFPAYYRSHNTSFSINNFVPTATYCSGGSVVLRIDPESATNDSPLKYPALTYIWFKETSTTTRDQVGTGTSLTASQPGLYYVETNYGSCSPSNSHSNKVTVNVASSGSVVTVTSSLGDTFCPNDPPTVLSSSSSANSYQWHKNGALIKDAIKQQYQTNEAGLYTVALDFGGCVSNPSITLKVAEIKSSINVPTTSTILEGETKTVIATTDAVNPTFQWYQNNVITGVTGNTFDVTTQGDYKVVIRQTSGCDTSNEIPFELRHSANVDKIPNIISLSSSYPFNVWDIPNEYKNPKTHVLIISSLGAIALDTYDYQSNWPASGTLDFKNINPVYYYVITSDTVEKKGSITVIK